MVSPKNINLLTGTYLAQARVYTAAAKAAAAEAVLFLLFVLIVPALLLTISLMQAAVYRNDQTLGLPEVAEADSVNRLAVQALQQAENDARYFTKDNIDAALLGVIASAVTPASGLAVHALTIDNNEQNILIDGTANDAGAVAAFAGRLAAGGYFSEVGIASLESGNGKFTFLLELKPAGGRAS